jgi:hypothetical protein
VSRYGDIRERTKARFKFSHYPTWSCYLKVWARIKHERFELKEDENFEFMPVGELIEYEDLDTYEWNGSGNPCFEDKNKFYNDDENLIESEEWIEFEAKEVVSDEQDEAFNDWSQSVSDSVSSFLEGDLPSGDIDLDVPLASNAPSLGGMTTATLEVKFTAIKNYEPPWPNE